MTVSSFLGITASPRISKQQRTIRARTVETGALHDDTEHAPGSEPIPEFPGMPRDELELLEELGHGSTGTVYRARLRRPLHDLAAGTEVAVKFLRPELMEDADAQTQLIAEGRLGQRIRSEHVVRIHDVRSIGAQSPGGQVSGGRVSGGQGTGVTYLVMELIDGRTLREVLQQSGSVVEELARRIGLLAASGLRAVHRLNLVHRDVKPENLALTEAGTVKLMDLGLARKATRGLAGSEGSGFFGSLSYAAPEVLRGEPATPQSDLYSLGVVLFEIITGVHPFATADTDPDQVIRAHLEDPPPRPSHFKPRISAFLEQLILDLLAKRPADRPRDATELEATLRRGENSRYWLRHERRAPQLTSRRRLRAMRRVADAPFVGRRDELRELDNHLRRASDGRGRAVFLTGPRGMGRRRLLDHWLEGVLDRRSDLMFLGGEARGGEGRQRAAPFTEMILEWFLRGDQPDSPQAQSRLASRMGASTSLDRADIDRIAAVVCGTSPDSSAEERADLLARLILSMRPEHQTLVLRVDLAEQLSTTAMLVVRQLIDGLADQRILLILVSLDGRRPPEGAEHIALAGLSEDGFLALGRQLFTERRVDKALLREAHATLAGSPGNLLDALAGLVRQGKLAGPIGRYRFLLPVSHLRPAASLLDRLHERLADLTEPQRFVHVAAAVLGNTFPISDLSSLVGQTELAVLETLSVFLGRIIVTQRGEGRFRHRDFRTVMLDMTPPTVLIRLHRTAAWILEDRGASSLQVGLHLSRAGEHDAALEPLLQGLAHLTATGSRQQSLKIRNRLRAHFDALPADPRYSEKRMQFLALSGKTEELADREVRAMRDYADLLAMAGRLNDGFGQIDAHTALGRLELAQGHMRPALSHLESAEQLLLPESADPARLARLCGIRARVHGYLGRADAALADLRTALRNSSVEDGELVPHLHTDLARTEALRNDFTAALDNLDRAESRFARAGSNPGLLRVQLHRGHILAMIGNRERARRLLEDAARRARELSNRRAEAKAHLFLGEQAVWHRDPSSATDHLEFALQSSARDSSTRLAASIYLSTLGREFPTLEHDLQALDIPDLQIAWLLMQKDRTNYADLLGQAQQLARNVTLPLHLHRQLLYRTGHGTAARAMEKQIAERLPRGPLRRRFQQFMKRPGSGR